MAIVLAIEPDRRQAAQLTAIVRHQVDAELVIADTTEGALDAIGNRVPDLVLVPALLSPQDDAALAAALRVIAAAAHVRTLTIPVLASGVKRAPAGGGMLAKWRKQRAASPEPEGCDPAVFGEQIAAYLQEAAAERAQLEEDALLDAERIEAGAAVSSIELDDSVVAQPAIAPAADEVAATMRVDEPWIAAEPVHTSVVDEPWMAAESMQTTVVDEPWIAADPIQAVPVDEPWIAPEPIHALAVGLLDEPSSVPLIASLDESSIEEPSPTETLVDEASIDLSGELEELSVHADSRVVDDEAAGVFTITSDDHDTSVFDLMDHVPGILEPPSILEGVEAALDQIAATARLRPDPIRARRRRAATPPSTEAAVASASRREEPEAPRPDDASWVPMFLTAGRIWPALEGVPAETPAAHAEQPDWIELVASLRQDLERRRTDPASSADPVAARPSDGADARIHRLVKKPKMPVRKTKPVQDEWGFFDPERCGFSTLLAKLEEITEIS
jgi:hypothetical protein